MAFYVRLDPSVSSPGTVRNTEKPETIISVKLLVITIFVIRSLDVLKFNPNPITTVKFRHSIFDT